MEGDPLLSWWLCQGAASCPGPGQEAARKTQVQKHPSVFPGSSRPLLPCGMTGSSHRHIRSGTVSHAHMHTSRSCTRTGNKWVAQRSHPARLLSPFPCLPFANASLCAPSWAPPRPRSLAAVCPPQGRLRAVPTPCVLMQGHSPQASPTPGRATGARCPTAARSPSLLVSLPVHVAGREEGRSAGPALQASLRGGRSPVPPAAAPVTREVVPVRSAQAAVPAHFLPTPRPGPGAGRGASEQQGLKPRGDQMGRLLNLR